MRKVKAVFQNLHFAFGAIFYILGNPMGDLFQNKYRISSTRLQSWNYANAGMYFITICTKNRECYFGE
jgi:hypothetical protein